MIISNKKNPLGKVAIIHSPLFKCTISTAKESLFKKPSTIIFNGDYNEDKSKTLNCAKLIYTFSLSSSNRYKIHDGLTDEIDNLGENGTTLGDAIQLCFNSLKAKGLVIEAINLLHED